MDARRIRLTDHEPAAEAQASQLLAVIWWHSEQETPSRASASSGFPDRRQMLEDRPWLAA